MPELPGHLYKGRGAFAGPVIGGYISFCYGPKSYAATDAPTTIATPISFLAPCDFRLERIQYAVSAPFTGTGTGATDTLLVNFYKGTAGIVATDLATLGTKLASATDLTAKIATSTAVYTNYVDMSVTAAQAAAAATTSGAGAAVFNTTDSVRNIARGNQIYCALTAGGVIAPINNFGVQIIGFVTGHPNAESSND